MSTGRNATPTNAGTLGWPTAIVTPMHLHRDPLTHLHALFVAPKRRNGNGAPCSWRAHDLIFFGLVSPIMAGASAFNAA
jgi:hypothetical protein